MSLRSRLFAGYARLEAAAESNPAHILLGAVGRHVGKIQQALKLLDGDPIDPAELTAERYGPSTANAVLSFKKKRNIINRSYQTQADNIVGIMTMAALDQVCAGAGAGDGAKRPMLRGPCRHSGFANVGSWGELDAYSLD